MADLLNQNIEKTTQIIKEDELFVVGVSDFIKELKQGNNLAKLTQNTNDPILLLP